MEDLLSGSQEVLNNSLSQALSFTSGSVLQSSPIQSRRSASPSPSQIGSPRPTSGIGSIRREQSKSETHLSISYGSDRLDSNEVNKFIYFFWVSNNSFFLIKLNYIRFVVTCKQTTKKC